MVLDALAQAARYHRLHQAFPRAFEFLARADLTSLPPGRHEIDGDRMFVLIDHTEGRGHDGARLEAHRRHIDIQLAFDGTDEIGWRPLADCRHPAAPFDATKDLGFFDDRPDTWLVVPRGHFAIFFPDDAHAPLAGRGTIRKAVLKIATGNWGSEIGE